MPPPASPAPSQEINPRANLHVLALQPTKYLTRRDTDDDTTNARTKAAIIVPLLGILALIIAWIWVKRNKRRRRKAVHLKVIPVPARGAEPPALPNRPPESQFAPSRPLSQTSSPSTPKKIPRRPPPSITIPPPAARQFHISPSPSLGRKAPMLPPRPTAPSSGSSFAGPGPSSLQAASTGTGAAQSFVPQTQTGNSSLQDNPFGDQSGEGSARVARGGEGGRNEARALVGVVERDLEVAPPPPYTAV
ncbi:hypothetical protein T439DRAFT_379063 [Meredithblackwellia eburnea MCA 4105]